MGNPDDIPQWAWDEAKVSTEMFGYNDGDERIVASVSRAILKAKNDTIDQCVKIAEEHAEAEHDPNPRWLAEEIAQAIRNLKHEG